VLEHALAYGALEHQAVERILLVRGTPRRLEEYVAQASAAKLEPQGAAGPRDLREYDALPVRGASHLQLPPGAPSCPSAPPPSEPESQPQDSKPLPRTNSGSESSDT
jgi:hypothetical protein